MTAEKLLAAVGLVLCVLLLVRGMLPARRRERLDAAARRLAQRLRRFGTGIAQAWQRRRKHGAAAREAGEAIERARRGSERRRAPIDREGNVIRPRSFHGRRDDNGHLH